MVCTISLHSVNTISYLPSPAFFCVASSLASSSSRNMLLVQNYYVLVQSPRSTTKSPRNKMEEAIRILPFCVPLKALGEANEVGVVGTITLRGESAIVWFGWGAIERSEDDGNGSCFSNCVTSSVGTGRPPMGSLSLSMPSSSTHKGPSSIPTSQLLGGASEEDMMLGQQISARLAKRIGWPIFVSCSFSGWNGDSGQDGASPALGAVGFDDGTMPAVLAEKEVARILMIEKEAYRRLKNNTREYE